MKSSLNLLFCLILSLSACAPKVESRNLGGGTTDFGPRFKDIDLNTRLRQSDHNALDMSWKGTVATANFFHQAQNIYRLGLLHSNEDLKRKGIAWIKKFYQQPKTTSYQQLAQAPYATLAAAQTRHEVQETLTAIQTDLQKAKTTVKEHILNLGKSFPWAPRAVRIPVLITEAQNFTDLLIMQIPVMGLTSQVEEGLRAELLAQTKPYFKDIQAFTDSFYRSKTFSLSVGLIQQVLAKFNVTPSTELMASLNQGRMLGQEIDTMNDPQGALTVLVDIWKILTPEDRVKYYKSENSDLYGFLNKQDDKELTCLRTPGCNGGLIDGIAKKLFILPKIKDYGVIKLKQSLNQATLDYLISQVESYAVTFVREIPGIFADNIEKGLIKKADELRDVQIHYEPYMKDLLGKWSQKKLAASDGKVAGFEVSSINLIASKQQNLELQGVGSPSDLKANTAGSAMMASSLLMENLDANDSLGLQMALSQINKLITIGGYRDINDRLVPALLSPVEHVKSPLDIMNLSATNYSYRIPDRIQLQDPFHVNPGMDYEKNFSAASFAEQIEGLSHMLQVTADWKVSSFDRFLGNIQAQELTEDIQSPALQRGLFPKDMFFALNLGDVAVLLKDITKKATPVFLVSLDNKVVWADEYSNSQATTVMGGIVDIKDGKKSDIVRSQDVAKFLLAISDFLKATDGVENTKSSILLDKDSNNYSNLDALIEGRKDLKLLVVALANFISNQLVSESALVQAQYNLKEFKRQTDGNYQIDEQIYAMRALMAASQITGIDAYKWGAQEIYFAMNKQMFSPSEQFYVNSDGSKLDFPQKVSVLLALSELHPSLPEASQTQLSKIISPWLQALASLKN